MKTVIFRPTNNCNLRCSYCYDKNNHTSNTKEIIKLSTDIFKKEENNILNALSILYKDEKEPHIIFHGGEPLLIKPEILDIFCDKLKKIHNLTFSIQTNGTLINTDVIELFKKHNFKVGLSLDGCDEIQNHARVFPNGKNSFNTIMRKIDMLNDNNIKFGIIMSIGKLHQNKEQNLYNFISDKKFSCNISNLLTVVKNT